MAALDDADAEDFFRLAPLPPAAGPGFALAPLTSVAPRFVLPALDEDAPGVERLLGTLGSTLVRDVEVAVLPPLPSLPELARAPDPKGKGKGKGKAADIDAELWRLAGIPDAGPSRARAFHSVATWDDAGHDSPFMSERTPQYFESLLTSEEPPVHLPKLRTPSAASPVDVKVLLDLMMRATLGTTLTDDLRWSRREQRFVYAETGARPKGIERSTTDDLMHEFLTIGTAVRRLEIVLEEHGATPITPTHHALLHALSTIVAYLKQRLGAAVDRSLGEESAPLLQRASVLYDVVHLASTLCEIVCWPISQAKPVGLPAKPHAVLTLLHSHLVAQLSTSTDAGKSDGTTLALAYLLSRASEPFLALLQQWVGLADSSRIDDDEDPQSQPWADLGITRTRLPAADGIDVRWDYTFSARRMPAFVPRDARRTLFEAGRSLRALRDASGGLHPLCATDWHLSANWGWGSSANLPPNDLRLHIRRVHRDIDRWRGAAYSRIRTTSESSFASYGAGHQRRQTQQYDALSSRASSPTAAPPSPILASPPRALTDLWSAFSQPPGSHLGAMPEADTLWNPNVQDDLEAFIKVHADQAQPLLPQDCPTLELYISSHLLAPLLAHSALISSSLTQLYLDDLDFLQHLDVLRAFWLGGDTSFSETVAAALFTGDVSSGGENLGRRARTRARLGLPGVAEHGEATNRDWGIGLGLGLSDRQRWPPGGSELAYALRATLLDDSVDRLASRGPVWAAIEDRVSFAVRALPEDESDGRRSRWLNPQGEALDFIYLAYSPPAAIATLLPQSVMDKYQLIHNFLLRISRVEAVVRSLYFDVVRPSRVGEDVPIKTGVDAAFNRMPSQLGLGRRRVRSIFEPGSEAERTLLALRFVMSSFVAAISRYVLDTAIGHNWDVMRKRLDKLRRRGHAPSTTDSRPVTPGPDDGDDYEDLDEELDDVGGGEDEDDAPTLLGALSQLQSAHSLVLYHQIILNRILRACLLIPQPGHQVTFKLLMTLFGLILDLGKTVKEVEQGVSTPEAGGEHVVALHQDWTEKSAVFLHALERLSLRTSPRANGATATGTDEAGKGGQQDLQVLLGEDVGSGVSAPPVSHLPGSTELQELLLRLRLGSRDSSSSGDAVTAGRAGRW
ncbi:hypothetical protein Q8F55_002250 [Vanrija albida]|uniref:Spindle pole body component n=1 Tax=Vanrija albida TaxID=181172 RepID=A0ABR3Q996_9TREE